MPGWLRKAAASIDDGQERVYAGMTRALVCQAARDYLGMADALGHWQDGSALDDRSRAYALLRPGCCSPRAWSDPGSLEAAGFCAGPAPRPTAARSATHPPVPALAWLAKAAVARRTARRTAQEALVLSYERGQASPGVRSHPVSTTPGCCWLTVALLRRTGQRRQAVERLRQASEIYHAAARRTVHHPDRGGTRRLPPARRPSQEAVRADLDQPGDRGGPPGREGPVQPGNRGRAVHQPQGRRIPPGQHLRQMRSAGPPAAAPLRLEQWHQPATA